MLINNLINGERLRIGAKVPTLLVLYCIKEDFDGGGSMEKEETRDDTVVVTRSEGQTVQPSDGGKTLNSIRTGTP